MDFFEPKSLQSLKVCIAGVIICLSIQTRICWKTPDLHPVLYPSPLTKVTLVSGSTKWWSSQDSMDWCKGKSTGNYGFYISAIYVLQWNMITWGFHVNFPIIQCQFYEHLQKPVTSPCYPTNVVGTDLLAEAQEQHEDDRGRPCHGMRQGNHVSPDHVDQLPEKNLDIWTEKGQGNCWGYEWIW